MKLLAQHGHAEGQKVLDGIRNNLIDGVIFSPKDIRLDNLATKCASILDAHPSSEVLLDPQVYTALFANDPGANLGWLEEYEGYFKPLTRSRLEIEKNVRDVLRDSVAFQKKIRLTGIIAPNILISRSFDSREATISKTFIRLAKDVARKLKVSMPVYSTLAVSREALTNPEELKEFLNDITVVDSPPDGIYLLIAGRSTESRLEIFNADVISGWLLMNFSFTINGLKVINGYSDIVTPFLGVVGGEMGASGWYSNLRMFSMERFLPVAKGGRQAIQRYLSKALLNRIRFDEYRAWSEILPDIKNNLQYDSPFEQSADPKTQEDEPTRNDELYQSWEALKSIINDLVVDDISEGIKKSEATLERADSIYEKIKELGIRPDAKSNRDHVEPLREGIREFRRLAQI